MAADDFLLIAPESWIEIPNADAMVRAVTSFEQMLESIQAQEWVNVSQFLEDNGVIEPNTLIIDARIINANDQIQMWYKQ